MSYPYPQDRNRDRNEKAEQPYEDAREAFSENQAQIQRDEAAYGEAEQREATASLRNASPEQRKQMLEAAMEEQLDETTDEIMAESEKGTGRTR